MEASRLLLLIFVVASTSERSEAAEPQCEDYDYEVSFSLPEGEAFYFELDSLNESDVINKELTWYKNISKDEYISSNETERIHAHGRALLILNLLLQDSGFYTARHIEPSGECTNYIVRVDVFNSSYQGNDCIYSDIKNSFENKDVTCPDPVILPCAVFGGNFTWYKDLRLLEGQHDAKLWVQKANQDINLGIYNCICTWTHNNRTYQSSGCRRLIHEKTISYRNEILSPTNKEQIADEGLEIKLNCSVFCGINANYKCHAYWHINGAPINQMDGYNQATTTITEGPLDKTISTAILTIEKVTVKDFQFKFKCIGEGFYKTKSANLTLKRRESIIPLVITSVCVLSFCVFAAVLVKCFAVDFALFFRRYLPVGSHNKDARLYDAYVVYQTQNVDQVMEDALCRFLTQILPSVLEEKCGYRLFIHGRDDIPGEDRVALVEDSMKQSRRLMVILTPGSGSGSEFTDQDPTLTQTSVVGGFDWQVGLHHVLVQREMSVILIQLGDTGPQGYTHLPIGLQHLISKSAPLKWPEGSRGAAAWNSRFWKRVRYLMPARPAKICQPSVMV